MVRLSHLLLSCVTIAVIPAARLLAEGPDEPVADQIVEFAPPSEGVGRISKNGNSAQTDAPYTLVDKFGAVRYYLAPTPGVDLSALEGRMVKVRGQVSQGSDESIQRMEVEAVALPKGDNSPQAQRYRRKSGKQPVTQAQHQEAALQPIPEELPSGNMTGSPSGLGANGAPGSMAPMADQVDEGSGPMTDYLEENCCPTCGGCGDCGCGLPGNYWVRPEYLYWWTQGMHVPALVTSGPSTTQPGFIGESSTQILFGNAFYNNFGRSGGRITAGAWLNSCRTLGIEGDYFGLASATTSYSATSGGDPILSRPFFDTRPSLAAQNVEQVASPGSIEGTVSANIPTSFQSAGLRMLFNWCCSQTCYNDDCWPCFNGPGGYRLDFLLGYRYARLTDGVGITENLTSINPNLPGSFVVNDNFHSSNQFNGVEFGTHVLAYRGRWSVEWMQKLAMGNVNQVVDISGSTATTQNGSTTVDTGGLLAQSSNIGHYARNQFAVMPQLGLNLGYNITPQIRAIVGYTFVYISQVARAGEQIDTDVNSTLLPNSPTPPTGDLRHPQFVYHEADFWAQGINAGLDFRW